ncbi:unnamed protein product [Lymnaea stagnalis]|uniref:G-protein coupled receptors family 3 profile domain-containing protein n=1 Tax=Lymnaea stagnalis TaxID=6523 RepID=A0AAV2I8G2_LYMST
MHFTATDNSLTSYKVVGVIGTDDSVTSGPVAQILSVSNMPLISFWASNDALSNKLIYPNFWRVLAPDTYLLLALTDFLTLHNFNYVSVMFSGTRRSISMYWTLKRQLSLMKICVSRKLMINEGTNITDLLSEMLNDELASRIIVVVGDHMLTNAIMSSVSGSVFEGKFLWIGNDFWGIFIHENRAPQGSIALHYNSVPLPDFSSYLRGLDIHNKNPWFLKALTDIDGCSNIDCINRRIETTIQNPNEVLALMHDCPFVIAHALDRFLRSKCPGLREKLVSNCFYANFNSFSQFISEVKFERNSQMFEFSKQHHGFEVFSMIQSAFDISAVPLEISQYSIRRRTTMIINRISTSQLLIPYSMLEPQNYCMIPCSAGEYRFYISRCCWKCRECQDNQRVSEDFKTCERCPSLHWPKISKGKRNKCEKITPDHFDLFSLKSAIMIVVACLGIISVVYILSEYLKNKSHPVIKASSLELSVIQLVFILLGYFSVPVIVDRPTALRCTIGTLLFTTSFNISYFTMLIKAVRVYRIFTLSKKGKTVTCTSPAFQVSVCAAFLCCEVRSFN